jgi:NDP-sugar pyrophosphorylase family protein
MKAVILAGGEGTRLRPLTLSLPKPAVPVVDRPFLSHQLDMLGRAGVSEVIFSVAYRPERIRAVFGEGTPAQRIRYVVEETPLGTGGAVKNAEPWLDDTTLVLNGDILTDVDLDVLVALHRERRAAATLLLTPVANPCAYGLVETDADGRIRRFTEKPRPEEITTDTINAGIYVLETRALELMPAGVNHSIERGFFPALLGRGDYVAAHVHGGYWIDIGTPEKYLQVHRDILHQDFPVELRGVARAGGWIAADAYVDPSARLEAPFFIGPGCRVEAEAHVGPETTLVQDVHLGAGCHVARSVLWAGVQVGAHAQVEGALLAQRVRVGCHASVTGGAVLGEGSQLGDYSRT